MSSNQTPAGGPPADEASGTPSRLAALERLSEGLGAREPFQLLTGASGVGKTSLVGELAASWDARAVVALVEVGAASPTELIERILRCFEIEPPANVAKPQLLDRFERHIAESEGGGRIPVIVVDDADALSDDLLGELWALAKLALLTQRPLEIVLVGTPELEARLSKPPLDSIGQHIGVRHHLEAQARVAEKRAPSSPTPASAPVPTPSPAPVAEAAPAAPPPAEAPAPVTSAAAAPPPAPARAPVEETTTAAPPAAPAAAARTPAPAAPPAPARSPAPVAAAAQARTRAPASPPAPARTPATAPPASKAQSARKQAASEPAAATEPAVAKSAEAPKTPADPRVRDWIERFIKPDEPRFGDLLGTAPTKNMGAFDPSPPAEDEEVPAEGAPEAAVAAHPALRRGSRRRNDRRRSDRRRPRSTNKPWAVRMIPVGVILLLIAGLAIVLIPRGRAPSPRGDATAVQPSATTGTSSKTGKKAPAATAQATQPATRKPATETPTPAPAAAPASEELFALDVGSQPYPDWAEDERDRIVSETGLKGWVVTGEQDGVEVYRVVLGTFRSRERAQTSAKNLLARDVVPEARVIPLPPRRLRR